jgi:hypothetical protein
MKESIFPTCTGDDGQRIYLIFSPSSILDLFWNISGRNVFLRSRFLSQTRNISKHALQISIKISFLLNLAQQIIVVN